MKKLLDRIDHNKYGSNGAREMPSEREPGPSTEIDLGADAYSGAGPAELRRHAFARVSTWGSSLPTAAAWERHFGASEDESRKTSYTKAPSVTRSRYATMLLVAYRLFYRSAFLVFRPGFFWRSHSADSLAEYGPAPRQRAGMCYSSALPTTWKTRNTYFRRTTA